MGDLTKILREILGLRSPLPFPGCPGARAGKCPKECSEECFLELSGLQKVMEHSLEHFGALRARHPKPPFGTLSPGQPGEAARCREAKLFARQFCRSIAAQ